ncbi:hydrogen peroxide-inducible genes activator [Jiulongibacter sediminis]|uniref:hydrogen peroxide-inducible genes activator n=1 Tax=Jiulongibacter sediminis TaxID=1605367 RepID=UPI0026EC4377|nr:hydrogen peroxide-inducible genes activator [Jiulongibacter sediminis]
MTISQIQYLIAVAKHKNFSKAAAECFISQPALSMQIKQLEDELGGKLFDRSKNPLMLTPMGEKAVNQAEITYYEFKKLSCLAEDNQEPSGEITLGIIPTLAPYLLPIFIKEYTKKYPRVKLNIRELTTAEIIEEITNYNLDTALLATPLHHQELIEIPLFYERMLAYVSPESSLYQKEYAIASEIDPNELWLLEEGHCLRSQILKLCELRNQSEMSSNITFKAGSVETLMRLVDNYQGITIVPELATVHLGEISKAKLRNFLKPEPTREISLIHHQYCSKQSIINSLEESIRGQIPDKFLQENKRVIEVL